MVHHIWVLHYIDLSVRFTPKGLGFEIGVLFFQLRCTILLSGSFSKYCGFTPSGETKHPYMEMGSAILLSTVFLSLI